MARMPRLFVEGCAQHIVQRGNNRSVFFRRGGLRVLLPKIKGMRGEVRSQRPRICFNDL